MEAYPRSAYDSYCEQYRGHYHSSSRARYLRRTRQSCAYPSRHKGDGFYKNDNKIGQSRLSIVWREMITPQGVNILLTNAMSADSRGINGIEGFLDNKFDQRYGLGLFLNTLEQWAYDKHFKPHAKGRLKHKPIHRTAFLQCTRGYQQYFQTAHTRTSQD